MQPPAPRLEIDRVTPSSTSSFRRSSDEGPHGVDESRRTASLAEIPAVDALHDEQDTAAWAVEEKDDEEEFEFAVFSGGALEPITADEIFSNGQIRPMYPLFSHARVPDDAEVRQADAAGVAAKPVRLTLRKIMMDDRDPPSIASSSAGWSESDELEGIPADSYCVWTPRSVPPSPDQLRKRSHSTGDSFRRWRLRDLVLGRSHSDGRKKFVFLAAPQTAGAAADKAGKKQSTGDSPAAAENKKKAKGRVVEMDVVTAHRIYYGKGAAATEDRRRSFLPYRKNLVGLHPF